jgi:hypothetical protein
MATLNSDIKVVKQDAQGRVWVTRERKRQPECLLTAKADILIADIEVIARGAKTIKRWRVERPAAWLEPRLRA